MPEPETGYVVYLYDSSLETLGDAIEPYLQEHPSGKRICCREIDSGGSFFEMVLDRNAAGDAAAEIELIIPSNMVRMVVSTRDEEAFGFSRRRAPAPVASLPVVGPDAPAPQAPSKAVPDATAATGGTGTGNDGALPPEG